MITRNQVRHLIQRMSRTRFWRNLISIPLAIWMISEFQWGIYLVVAYVLLRVNNATAMGDYVHSLFLETLPDRADEGSDSGVQDEKAGEGSV
jgi:hypothetical protein